MRPKLVSVQDSAEWLIKQNDASVEEHEIVSEVIRSRVAETLEPYQTLEEKVNEKQDELNTTFARRADLDQLCAELSDQLSELETRTILLKPLSVLPDVLGEQVSQIDSIEKDAVRMAPLVKKLATDAKQRTKRAHGTEAKDIENKVGELKKRKESIDELLKSRRNDSELLHPVAKAFDETVRSMEPIIREAEEKLSTVSEVPTDEKECRQQKMQLKVRMT